MAKVKYLQKVEEFIKKTPVVNIASIKQFLKKKNYAYILIKNLITKGELKRLTKGWYTAYDDPSLAVFCFKPAYLGLEDALSFHGLWEQETIPVIITTRKIRQGIRKILGMNVLIRRIDKRYYFGVEYLKYFDFYLPVSDVEKTFLDIVYFYKTIDPLLLKKFRKEMDSKKLKKYLSKYPKRFQIKISKLLKQKVL